MLSCVLSCVPWSFSSPLRAAVRREGREGEAVRAPLCLCAVSPRTAEQITRSVVSRKKRSFRLNELMENRHLPLAATSREDGVPVEEDFDDLKDDKSPEDEMIGTPSVYSWGRCDTNALLRSYNEPPAIDGVQTLTFANNRTIVQVKLLSLS